MALERFTLLLGFALTAPMLFFAMRGQVRPWARVIAFVGVLLAAGAWWKLASQEGVLGSGTVYLGLFVGALSPFILAFLFQRAWRWASTKRRSDTSGE